MSSKLRLFVSLFVAAGSTIFMQSNAFANGPCVEVIERPPVYVSDVRIAYGEKIQPKEIAPTVKGRIFCIKSGPGTKGK